MRTIESISKASIQLLLSEPFYGHFLMGLPKTMSTDTESLAITLRNRQVLQLIVNPEYWDQLPEAHRYGLLKHEILHLIFQHFFIAKNYANSSLFGIAADLVVNQYIDQEQLPEDSIFLEKLAYLESMYGVVLESGKGVDYYYHQLALSPLPQVSSVVLERHEFWKALKTLSSAEQKIATYPVAQLLQQAGKRVQAQNYGNLPPLLIEKIKQVLETSQPRVHWRRLLRLFMTSGNSTFLKNTIRRPSRRYGSVPGIKIRRRNRFLVAIDTSGSIQQESVVDFFSEINAIWRQGAEVRIVECDTSIHTIYDYKGVRPTAIHGRGSTSFDTPILYANETYHPDALIYFTDGFGAAPETLPRYPMLWVIPASGLKENEGIWKTLPGRKLRMSNKLNI